MKYLFVTVTTIIFLLLASPIAKAQKDTAITISEVMYSAPGTTNEFIELYNTSAKDTINVKDWYLRYSDSSWNQIVSANYGTLIKPHQYAVLVVDNYAGGLDYLIPSESLLLKIHQYSFGKSGLKNATNQKIFLCNGVKGDTIDTYLHELGKVITGRSDEKINLTKDNSVSNWTTTKYYLGTPGRINSATPKKYDLELSLFSIQPQIVFAGSSLAIHVAITNNGNSPATNYHVQLMRYKGKDTIPVTGELTNGITTLSPKDSSYFDMVINSIDTGSYKYIVKILYPVDEDTLNNKDTVSFNVYKQTSFYNDVVINEMMYGPSGDEQEWIEIYNKSNRTVNLKKWKVCDPSRQTAITTKDFFIPSGSYAIIAKDTLPQRYPHLNCPLAYSSIPIMNNDGDNIAIRDSFDLVIDSVTYSPLWGGSGGYSLERKYFDSSSSSADNWGSSLNYKKATPGFVNSITPKDFDIAITAFAPKRSYYDEYEDVACTVSLLNRGKFTSDSIHICLYKVAGQDSLPKSENVILNLTRQPLSSGAADVFTCTVGKYKADSLYFMVQATVPKDDDTTNNFAYTLVNVLNINDKRSDIIINEIMYAPPAKEPEWFELYNRSAKTLNLQKYHFADATDTVALSKNSVTLNPGEYCVIAHDSTIFKKYVPPSKTIISTFPALNNDGDNLLLLDSLYRIIDSLDYLPSWGGTNGYSLERIDANAGSNDSTNWKTAKVKVRATPGYINSQTKKNYDLELHSITSVNPYPVTGDTISLTVKIYNTGYQTVSGLLQLYGDRNLDSISDTLLMRSNMFTVPTGDSAELIFPHISVMDSVKGFYGKLIADADEDTSDNYLYTIITPSYKPGIILVNEIMYAPSKDEPEWIELYNTSSDSISLSGWSVSDILAKPSRVQITRKISIPPLQYIVITRDSSIFSYYPALHSDLIVSSLPAFNNDEDGVVIYDNNGRAIDSIHYHATWGGKNGFSLERKNVLPDGNNPDNWGTSKSRFHGTPGYINSLIPKAHDVAIIHASASPEFPIEGESLVPNAMIKNEGAGVLQNIEVSMYYTQKGNTPYVLLNKQSVSVLQPGDSILVISGSNTPSIHDSVSLYTIASVSPDEDTSNNYYATTISTGVKKGSVLINEVMFDPLPKSGEWVELYNSTVNNINLKAWTISDVLTTPTEASITDTDLILHPQQSLIVSRDSLPVPGLQSNITHIIAPFGTLNNSGDGIIVRDRRGAVIDSLLYQSNWNVKHGKSIERISLSGATNDSLNWIFSYDPSGGTPGKQNSIDSVQAGKQNGVIINEIMYEPDVTNSEFIELQNISDTPVLLTGWTILTANKNLFYITDTVVTLPAKSFFVLCADSSGLLQYPFLQSYPYKSVLQSGSLGLLNSNSTIVLRDAMKQTIDSVYYKTNWHNKNFSVTRNRSLERINPSVSSNDARNWSSSVGKGAATPGEANSIYTGKISGSSQMTLSPNPFSPDNDGFEDFTTINFNTPFPFAQVSIKIFDDKGRLMRELTNNESFGSSGTIIYDGRDNNGNPLRIGMYIVLLEAVNPQTGAKQVNKGVLVSARKL